MPPEDIIASTPIVRPEPPRNVLVLGSTEHPKQVTSFGWASLPGYISFADYDVVIINLAALAEVDDLSVVTNVPKATALGRTLFSPNTEVLVIRDFVERDEVGAWFWSPIRFNTVHEPGEVVCDVNSAWSWYFDRVPIYADYFTRAYQEVWPAESYFRSLSIPADTHGVALDSIASSRDGRPIAVAAQLMARRRDGYNTHSEVTRSSTMVVLPTLNGVASSEVANLILQSRYGFEITTPAPEWSGAYVLSSHAPLLGELAAGRKTIADAQSRLPDAMRREAHAGRPQALLYEGNDALEPLVREALGMLGGAVVEPTKKGIEDGRVTSPDGAVYVIEVKGLTGEVKRAHVRQLQDWVTAAQTDEDLDCRGLLVANVYRTQPPNERAPAITGQVVNAARRFSHAVITTTQLFQAIATSRPATSPRTRSGRPSPTRGVSSTFRSSPRGTSRCDN